MQIVDSHFAHTGRRTLCELPRHLALGSLTEAVVRYLHPSLHTTAALHVYANILVKRAESSASFGLYPIQTAKSRQLSDRHPCG
jgi:hypothetical protein